MRKKMTTYTGRPVGDNQNSLTVGARGPIVGEVVLLFEKMAHFNRERIPERIVHAKGSGVYGYFICNNPNMPKFTAAKLFSAVGKKTPTFLRFSTSAGRRAQQTPNAIRAVLPSSSTPKRVTGTWWATTHPFSLFAIR
jgi:catalase